MDHAVIYVAYSFLRNIKEIMSNNTMEWPPDAELPRFPPLIALNREHGEDLSFTFAEFDDNVMKTLNIEIQVQPSLEIINVSDAEATRVGHVTPIPSLVSDVYITFCESSLRETAKRNHTGTMVIK